MVDGYDVCPTEEFPQLITFKEYFVQTWLGDNSKIFRNMWNVYTETDKRTNNHVKGSNSKFAKVLGKHHPNIFQFMVAIHDAAVPPPHNKNN